MIEKIDQERSSKFSWNRQKEIDERGVTKLLKEYPKLHQTVAKILVSKNLLSTHSIQQYFSSNLEEHVSRLELKDLEKSAERLIRAISRKE